MAGRVVLDLACCPAGSAPERTVRRAGGKAVVLAAAGVAPVVPTEVCDGEGDVAGDPVAWGWQVAGLLGLHREAVVAGCPVPLADEATTWARVADELAGDRWDVVVLRAAPAGVGRLVEAPEVLVRVLDARLDALAAAVGADPHAAAEVATLLDLRPRLLALRSTAGAAVVVGHPHQHREHGCSRPGALAVASVDRDDPVSAQRPATGVRRDGDGFVWWLDLPAGEVPQLHREDDRLLVATGAQQRTLPLPSALARCAVRAATVVADRLEVRFAPDPDAWR